jgi:hypothetical protein
MTITITCTFFFVNKFWHLYAYFNTGSDPERYVVQNVSLLSAQGICHANVLTTVPFYDELSTKSYMISIQPSPRVSENCNKSFLYRELYRFTPRNMLQVNAQNTCTICDWLKVVKFSQRICLRKNLEIK